jgi:hypothetical protein
LRGCVVGGVLMGNRMVLAFGAWRLHNETPTAYR